MIEFDNKRETAGKRDRIFSLSYISLFLYNVGRKERERKNMSKRREIKSQIEAMLWRRVLFIQRREM